jgi:hypothetical protein
MADIISSLREDHRHILSSLERIKNIGTDYASMREALKEMKEAFLAHVALEDTEFYVNLRRKARLSDDLIRTLDFLVRDLEGLKISSLIFFEKHAKEQTEYMERDFAADFHNFYQKVLRRVELEEEQLFPLFGKYIRQSSQGSKK